MLVAVHFQAFDGNIITSKNNCTGSSALKKDGGCTWENLYSYLFSLFLNGSCVLPFVLSFMFTVLSGLWFFGSLWSMKWLPTRWKLAWEMWHLTLPYKKDVKIHSSCMVCCGSLSSLLSVLVTCTMGIPCLFLARSRWVADCVGLSLAAEKRRSPVAP